MKFSDSGVKILVGALLNFAKENGRSIVLISSTRRVQIEIGMTREAYPRLVNSPFIKRHHGVELTATNPALLEKIETSAFGSDVPSCQQFVDMLDDYEQEWIKNIGRGGSQAYTVGGLNITGFIQGIAPNQYAIFDYRMGPSIIVDYKSDYNW